ncbi:ABC transporter permease [Actinacidiphila yanglinensis]|uniref:ABC transporter permease n=1 Tax=Actinacidiphila yanglinensis TaxID=310779 RepID=UPI00135A43A1|nr:ABC transporter permease [Actinacidiphila yanglinensis]
MGSSIAVHAVYAGKEERRIARTPVIAADDVHRSGNSTTWLVGSDSLSGQRRFSVVYLAPHKGDAPLPPGVDAWPAPGQAVLSPALRKAGAAEDIDHRYGRLAGTIKAEGLDEPTEWLAYVRPRGGLAAKEPSDLITGFGPSAGSSIAPGLEPGSGRDDDKPEWMFQAAILGMLCLPSLALLLVAARTGAHARDRRTALVTALGGRRRDRALVAIGEAALPVLLGALLGAAAVATALRYDVHVPCTGYIVSSGFLRQYCWWLGVAPVVALLAVLAAVVLADLAQRQAATDARPRSAARIAWISRLAALCPLMILLAVRGPGLAEPGSDSVGRILISWAGIAGTVLTLPAAVATVVAAAGRVLTRWGQRRALPGTLVAGRRITAHPGATARLVTGITVALIVLMQAVAWQGLFGSQSAEAQRTLDRIGRSAVSVGTNGRVPPSDMSAFLNRLPETEALLLVPPADPGNAGSPMSLYGSCEALATVGLGCPKTEQRISGVPQDPRLQEFIRWTPHGALLLDVRRTDTVELAHRAASAAEESLLAVLSRDGRDLSIPYLKRLAYAVFPRGAHVGAPGEDQVTAGIPNRDQGRWSTLLGVIGICVLTVTAGLSAMAEFLRQGRALAPLTVLTGGLRLFRSSSAWSVLAPIALAGLAGSVVAVGLAAPVTADGKSYITPELLWSTTGIVLLVSVLMWLWATIVAVRQARAWRPRGD